MRRAVTLLLALAAALAAQEPPVFIEGDEPPLPAGPEDGEFDLAELFGEGLLFVGRLDLWARYYHTPEREFGGYDEARFALTSRSGPTRVDLLL
ncbi:MAG TPA: hypothetical protein ENN88_04385, partial [Candidatus Coatesbacteria bacterium]|nr:hypothetical protein [Candidatus Coatesbacteria bacterium]